jgi:aryl-alcohol dehydrogenase-like predicted oxidoreductase
MLPLCEAEGIGVVPWSLLARGRLARGWDVAAIAPRPTSSARNLGPKRGQTFPCIPGM